MVRLAAGCSSFQQADADLPCRAERCLAALHLQVNLQDATGRAQRCMACMRASVSFGCASGSIAQHRQCPLPFPTLPLTPFAGCTALYMAVGRGNVAVAERLLEGGLRWHCITTWCSMGVHAGCCAVPGGCRTRESESQLQRQLWTDGSIIRNTHPSSSFCPFLCT